MIHKQSILSVTLISTHTYLLGVDRREKYTKYKMDDCSGASVQCTHWINSPQYKMGDLTCVRGKVGEFRGRKEVKVQQIFEMVKFVRDCTDVYVLK